MHDDGDHHDDGADDCTDRRNGGEASGGVWCDSVKSQLLKINVFFFFSSSSFFCLVSLSSVPKQKVGSTV